ncbi:MAG: GRP family sugar transporter [Bifidobacterium bifidum]
MWPILLALVPAFGWGFQGIVMQKVGGTTANKQMGMVLTTLLFGIVVLIFHPINWSWTLIAAAGHQRHPVEHRADTADQVLRLSGRGPRHAAVHWHAAGVHHPARRAVLP